MWKLCPLPFSKFLATPVPSLVVDEENLVIGFGSPHFRNASAIAGCVRRFFNRKYDKMLSHHEERKNCRTVTVIDLFSCPF